MREKGAWGTEGRTQPRGARDEGSGKTGDNEKKTAFLNDHSKERG